ncbi:exopolysaccharide biosynthesis polyprenyl glycosylphosphotransferase [Deinococcus marmoris]|uniref:Undecaprenyl-phosphate galactosephosphotransferase n=1 Tax=Deinococcus marmoris TaxID=249408 RepID=A0A1U7NRS6_9DEIO|nr:exopolysaccharide biosynthesis polyprenyl glycosylphosphotransferase [Deinococcus marmoris]OLV15620.1 Undecaprenyl-phosphate galactosephosphotransferase [Deinococcus marmoris]
MIESDFSEKQLTQRDLIRERRAHVYLRRHILDGAALGIGQLASWTLTALLVNGMIRLFHQEGITVDFWVTLAALHLIITYAAKLLPGWGLGIVAELRYTIQIAFFLTLSMTVIAYLTSHHPDVALKGVLTLVVLVPALLIMRSLIKTLLLRYGLWGVQAVIYGGALTGRRVIEALRKERGLGYQPVAVFDDDPALLNQLVAGVRVVGNTAEWLQEAPIAIVAIPGAENGRITELIDGPLSVYRSVIIIPDLFNVQSLWARTQDLDGILGVQVTQNLADPFARRFKRAVDLALAALSLPLWGSLCLLIGLFIWLEDRHHPLFFQQRVGLGGATFRTWKFRTMMPDAETVLKAHLERDPVLRQEWETHFKLRRDPRITSIGKLLRKTSLDELPQLVNVLKGDMSLVGPRPLPQYHQQELPVRVQHLRYEVRPGMTGLWQVSGRSDAGNEGMIQLDPYYVRNWSVWLDLAILLRTARAVLASAGAY